MDKWTDYASHKPWPRMNRLLHTSCVAKEINGQMDRLYFTQAVAEEKMDRWTDYASHKPWPRTDRLCFTQAVVQNGQTLAVANAKRCPYIHIDYASHKPWPRMDRLLHTSRGPEWTDCITQAVKEKMDRWAGYASHKPWPRTNRLCFTQAVTQNEQTLAVANAKRCPIILCLSSYFNLIKSAL